MAKLYGSEDGLAGNRERPGRDIHLHRGLEARPGNRNRHERHAELAPDAGSGGIHRSHPHEQRSQRLDHSERAAHAWTLSPASFNPGPGTIKIPIPDRQRESAGHRHQRLSAPHPQAARRRQRRTGDGDCSVRTRGSSRPRTYNASPTGRRPTKPSWMASKPLSPASRRMMLYSPTWPGTVRS